MTSMNWISATPEIANQNIALGSIRDSSKKQAELLLTRWCWLEDGDSDDDDDDDDDGDDDGAMMMMMMMMMTMMMALMMRMMMSTMIMTHLCTNA